ncbi:MAG: hypothetical protein K1X28_06600 [Parachlamydiales bacterium]|nr:hypothetical protein [Parachlamydiales bacterium]
MSAITGFCSDVWEGFKTTLPGRNVFTRTVSAAVALPLLNFGLSYAGCSKVPGMISSDQINPEVNAALTVAAGAAATTLVLEGARGIYNGIVNFVHNVGAASTARQLLKVRKDLLAAVNKEIETIDNEDAKPGNQPRTELQNLRTRLVALQGPLAAAAARTQAELSTDANAFHQLQQARALLLGIWGPLVAQETAPAHALRDHLTANVPNADITPDNLVALTVLKRQLDLNLRAKVKEEMDDLDVKIQAALLDPTSHPSAEYANLRTHLVQLDTHLQDVRTAAELDVAEAAIARLKTVKGQAAEIWESLKKQNKTDPGNALRDRLTALIPAQGHGNIDDASVANLARLKNQLALRQNVNEKIELLEKTKKWQGLLSQLQAVKTEQERILPLIAQKDAQIVALNTQIGAKQLEANGASDVKPWGWNAKSPKQIKLDEVAALQVQVRTIQGEIAQLRQGLVDLPYFGAIPQTVALLQTLPQSDARDLQIAHLQAIAPIYNQIAGAVGDAAKAQLRTQIQTHAHLQVANLNTLIGTTQTERDKLPKPVVAIGALTQAATLLGRFGAERGHLDAVLPDDPTYQARLAAYNTLAGDVPPVVAPVVVAPVAAPPAAEPGPVAAPPAAQSWLRKLLNNRKVQVVAGGTAALVTGFWAYPLVTGSVVAIAGGAFGFYPEDTKKVAMKAWDKLTQETPAAAVPPAVAVPPAALTPAAFDALGKVANPAGYNLAAIKIQSPKLKLDFSSKTIAFAAGQHHKELAASLQALAKVQPLMDRFTKTLDEVSLVERDLFTDKGAAQIGKDNAQQLLDAGKGDKVGALLRLATAFQSGAPIDRQALLPQLRALTKDGLDDIQGLGDQEKYRIFNLRLFLELEQVLRKGTNGTVTERELDDLYAAAKALKKPLEKAKPANYEWPAGDLQQSDIKTLTRLLFHGMEAGTVVERFMQGPDLNEACDRPVAAVFTDWQPEDEDATTVEFDGVKFKVVSILEANQGRFSALVRHHRPVISDTWKSFNKADAVQVGDLDGSPFNRDGRQVVFLVKV